MYPWSGMKLGTVLLSEEAQEYGHGYPFVLLLVLSQESVISGSSP